MTFWYFISSCYVCNKTLFTACQKSLFFENMNRRMKDMSNSINFFGKFFSQRLVQIFRHTKNRAINNIINNEVKYLYKMYSTIFLIILLTGFTLAASKAFSIVVSTDYCFTVKIIWTANAGSVFYDLPAFDFTTETCQTIDKTECIVETSTSIFNDVTITEGASLILDIYVFLQLLWSC